MGEVLPGMRFDHASIRHVSKLSRREFVGVAAAAAGFARFAAAQTATSYGNGTIPGDGTAGTNAWQKPLTLVGPRLFKFGGQLDW